MNLQQTLSLLLHANQLKRTARTGWVQRGVVNAENVAAHTYGMAFTALIMAQYVDEEIDTGRLLAIALLHDLPEALTTDIPSPAWRYMPPGIKYDVEKSAMQEILGRTDQTNQTDQLMHLWNELHANETAEAKLVHDADKLDMYLQARIYEDQTGNRHLAEFWSKPHTFHYPACQQIYDALRAEREQ